MPAFAGVGLDPVEPPHAGEIATERRAALANVWSIVVRGKSSPDELSCALVPEALIPNGRLFIVIHLVQVILAGAV